MKPIIIGIGNEFRGDDFVGLLIARLLKQKLPDTKIIESNGDITELLNYFTEFNSIIIIDAAITDNENSIGECTHLVVNKNSQIFDLKTFSSHLMGVIEAIKIAKHLNALPEEIHIYGIAGMNFNLTSTISERLLKKIENITETIIKNHFKKKN